MVSNITDLKPQQAPKDFPAMLKSFLPEIQRALPKHLSGDRMARIALTAFRRTPKLANCNPLSVFAAVIQASQLGLEPDTLGRAYLIPYGGECQFIPGWKGLVELLNRSGQGTAWTGAVFKGDEFDYMLGDSPFVHHKPGGEYDPNLLTHVYAVGRSKGAEWPIIEVWKIDRVAKHRDRYNKVGQKHYSYGNWEMYARKVVLLQVLKYLPASPELATAITMNDAAEVGAQHLTVNDAIEGTWQPVPESSDDNQQTGNTQTQNAGEPITDSNGEIYDPAKHATSSDEGGGPVYNKDGSFRLRRGAAQQQAAASGAPTAAEIGAMIDKATTNEALDLARDACNGLPDGEAKGSLKAAIINKFAELNQRNTQSNNSGYSME